MRSVIVCATLVGLALLVGCTSSPPDPKSGEIETARRSAIGTIEQVGTQLLSGEEPIATGSNDMCRTGQQNWKVQEIAFACLASSGWVISAAEGRDDIDAAFDAMEQQQASLNCEPQEKDWFAEAKRYWDEGVQSDPGRLPKSLFQCADTRIEIAPLSPESPRVTPMRLRTVLTGDTVGDPNVQEFPDDVEQRIVDSDHVLLWQLTVSQEYGHQD